MGRLDDLVAATKEETQTVGIKLTKEEAEALKVEAKDLGLSRTKLVRELFFAGLDELRAKRANVAD